MSDLLSAHTRKIPAEALPQSDKDRIAWLRLIRSRRVGPATFVRLVRQYRSAAAALAQLPEVARQAGVEDYQPCPEGVAAAEFAAGQRAGARLLCLGEDAYPALLAMIDDAPPVLWAVGDPQTAQRPTVALVGARNASSLGRRMAGKLAGGLAEAGFVVVSGLARGIDAEAHRASLETGTIAVHAGGVDHFYPPENADLAGRIADTGLRLSEMPPGTQPQASHFPRRNRIIAGLSQAVVVIEGALRSGSLITARDALDQGREVMAVPGHPLDARAGGCNQLIRDGATMVRTVEDILAALNRPAPPAPCNAPVAAPEATGEPEHLLLALLGPSPAAEDLVIRQSGLPVAAALAALGELELNNIVQRHPGGMVSLVA